MLLLPSPPIALRSHGGMRGRLGRCSGPRRSARAHVSSQWHAAYSLDEACTSHVRVDDGSSQSYYSSQSSPRTSPRLGWRPKQRPTPRPPTAPTRHGVLASRPPSRVQLASRLGLQSGRCPPPAPASRAHLTHNACCVMCDVWLRPTHSMCTHHGTMCTRTTHHWR